MKINLFYRLPLLVFCTFIAVQSHFPGVDISPRLAFGGDKIMHLGAFGLMGFLCCRWLKAERPLSGKITLLAAVFLVSLFGILDEFHQSFIPTRTASVYDVLADFAGAVLGTAVYLFCSKRRLEWLL